MLPHLNTRNNCTVLYLKHISSLVGADGGTAAGAGVVAPIPADGGVGGGACQVVQVHRGGEHQVGLPLHRLDVALPREPVAQLGPALVVLLAGARVAVLVRIVRFQQTDVFPKIQFLTFWIRKISRLKSLSLFTQSI